MLLYSSRSIKTEEIDRNIKILCFYYIELLFIKLKLDFNEIIRDSSHLPQPAPVPFYNAPIGLSSDA